MRSPTFSFLAGRAKARQRSSPSRLFVAAHAHARQPRGDHTRVVDHQRVSGTKERGRIAHMQIAEPARAGNGEQPRAFARVCGAQRDAVFRKIEIEEIDAHGSRELMGSGLLPDLEFGPRHARERGAAARP